MPRFLYVLCGILAVAIHTACCSAEEALVTGQLKQWHNVTLTIDGPQSSEDGTPNPFTDYRMEVAFMNADSGVSYIVPGYFAADGDAANTSATTGNKWRAHLCPDHEGEWTYRVSFRQGTNVAISDDASEGTPVEAVDGLEGMINIAATDKTGIDLRGKGRLNYVGKHHLQFAGTGDFFLKAGADAPENFLAYREFDGDFKTDGNKDNLIKDWQPHVQDWQPGDPTWQDGKGKGIIGAINYLASQGLNAFSFLTLNIDGDDRNVYPYTTYEQRSRIDCSRMDQWEIVLSHGDKMGMYLHFKTQEAENVNLLDGGELGPQRKLYYRELIARFSHHLALNWNLGEEVGLGHKVSTEKKVAWADYFWNHDPYQHHIVIHNGNRHYDLLGNASKLTGFSLQTNKPDFRNVHGQTLDYLRRSVQAGKPWVVACDEPGDASHALVPDDEDPTRNNARRNGLWGNIMAGGAGVEWYFGYKHAHSDLSCQDYRVRAKMWQQCRIALDFFADNNIAFEKMTNANDLLGTKNGYCLAESGKQYLVFLKRADTTTLDLFGADRVFEIRWFNPRTGGDLQLGSTQAVTGGGKVNLGQPPADSDQDWVAILTPGDSNAEYPPGVGAGSNTSIMLPNSKNQVTIDLDGFLTKAPGTSEADNGKLTGTWTKTSGPGEVLFDDASDPKTQVTLAGAGEYVLTLSANDQKQTATSSVTIKVQPFSAKVNRSLAAVEDVCIDGDKVVNDKHLKVEGNRRISFIKFDLLNLPPRISDAQLHLTVAGDGGSGTLKIFEGAHSYWRGAKIKKSALPKRKGTITTQEINAADGDVITIDANALLKGAGLHTLIVTLDEGGDDIWFGSAESGVGPKLVLTFDDPDGNFASFGDPVTSAASPGDPPNNQIASGNTNGIVLDAIKDFQFVVEGEFVPGYKDKNRQALAINAAEHQDKFAAAEAQFQGEAGTYDLVLTSLCETDGESSYRLLVSGTKVGQAKNPETEKDYAPVDHRFENITINPGDTIRVEFNSDSNGKIPEGDAFAFSRGRWRSVAIIKNATKPKQELGLKLQKAVESGDLIFVEAEDFPLQGDWAKVQSADSSGGAYLQFNGTNHYTSVDDKHTLTQEISIPQAGSYTVKWYMRQPADAEGDKSNDIWICFADAIQKGKGEEIAGFHKYYGRSKQTFDMNGSIEIGHEHSWLSVKFPQAGVYKMQISGRSELLQVDRFLLFKNMTADDARELAEIGQ